ncbi:MATE family efflux transporter [Jannaschia rubra]|uniref:MATE family efflux transporter n=1 Tax=Jannaschia rubra TaxID=282197 RepID=UPI00248F98E6|nr:MATE family efflux transporter [Jannaschia rubra]
MSVLPADSTTSPARVVFDLAWPLTLKAIMLHGIVVIDAYLVSGLGEQAIAVLGLAAAIAGLLLGVLLAFSNATQIRIAQASGTGDASFLKSALFSGFAINVAACALGLVLLAFAVGPIIDGLAHDAWIADQARRYLLVFAVVIAAESVHQCLSAYFNGTGETRLPLYSYLLGVPVNIGVSISFIHGLLGAPEMGVVGAAVGSATAALLQAAFLGLCLWRRTAFHRGVPGWRNGTFRASLRRHLAFAWPIAATFVSATVASNVCMLLYAKLDVNAFAAMTLIMPWVQVAGTVGMSWAQATGIIVAQLLGSDRRGETLERFLGGAWRAAFVAAGVVAAIYLTIIALSPWIYSELHPTTRATLLSFWPVLLLLPFPKGSNAICGNTLRAAGETVYVMHVFVWSQWLFRVPVTALLVLYPGVPVVWVFSLLLVEELIKFPAFHSRLFRGDWKLASVET